MKYQQVLDAATFDHPYEYYKLRLAQAAEAVQTRVDRPLSEEESIGHRYRVRLGNIIDARLGLARLYMNKQAYREARAEIQQSVMAVSQVGTDGGLRHLSNVESLPEIYDHLIEIETRAKLPGKIHIAKLNKQALEEYGRSQLAISDRVTSKNLIRADIDFAVWCLGSPEQLKCTSAVKLWKAARAEAGALLPAQASLVRFQTELLGTATKGPDLWLTPWGIASFGQQLVDPRLGCRHAGSHKGLCHGGRGRQDARPSAKRTASYPGRRRASHYAGH